MGAGGAGVNGPAPDRAGGLLRAEADDDAVGGARRDAEGAVMGRGGSAEAGLRRGDVGRRHDQRHRAFRGGAVTDGLRVALGEGGGVVEQDVGPLAAARHQPGIALGAGGLVDQDGRDAPPRLWDRQPALRDG